MLDDDRKQMNPPPYFGNPPQIPETVEGPEKNPPRAQKTTEMTLKKNPSPHIYRQPLFCKKRDPVWYILASAGPFLIYIRI